MTSLTKDDIKDVYDFLSHTHPLDQLSEPALLELVPLLSIHYFSKDQKSIALNGNVYLIKKGAVELYQVGQLTDRLSEGQFFGISSVLNPDEADFSIRPIEDLLVYSCSADDFISLLTEHSALQQYFEAVASERFIDLCAQQSPNVLEQSLRSLNLPIAVSTPMGTPVQAAAQLMTEHRISSLIITNNEKPIGIVTDKDIKTRVVAKGLSSQISISDIASSPVISLSMDASLLNAIDTLIAHQIHHLLIKDNGDNLFVISSSDLLRIQHNPLHTLLTQLNRTKKPSDVLKVKAKTLAPISQFNMETDLYTEAQQRISQTAHVLLTKAIDEAIELLGKPPCGFVWLNFGSAARGDLTMSSDQDNGLLIERLLNSEEAIYFQNLSENVCLQLNEWGYPLCPGNIMASNPHWRKTLPEWTGAFQQWVNTPKPENLLNATIFFDVHDAYSYQITAEKFFDSIMNACRGNDLFFMHLVRNANLSQTPLGFFRNFVIEHSGDHANELDIKHKGIAIINDLARILSLKQNVYRVNTIERLNHADPSILNSVLKTELVEAFRFLSALRLDQQAASMRLNKRPTHFVNPDNLTTIQQITLKQAFKTIRQAQRAVSMQFDPSLRG